jgi:hypothetical protein
MTAGAVQLNPEFMQNQSTLSVAGFLACLLLGQISLAQPAPQAPDEAILGKVREMDIKYTISDSGLIKFTFGVEQSRTQLVFMTGKVSNHLSTDYMNVLTRVMQVPRSEFSSRTAFDLLKKNWNYSTWFWQIKEEESDGKVYVYLGSAVPVTIPAVKLYRILSSMAQEADTTERLLTSKDEF